MRQKGIRTAFHLLLAAGTAAAPCFACELPEYSERYRGNHTVEISDGRPALLELVQFTEDLAVYVEGSEPYWINHPGGRNSVDYLYFEPDPSQSELRLCLYSRYSYSPAGSYRIENVDIASVDRSTADAYSSLHEAGRLWTSGRTEAIERATEIYATLAGEASLKEEIRLHSGFFSAMSLVDLRRYEDALSTFSGLDAQSHASQPIHYQRLWQMGRIQLRLGELAQSLELLQDSYSSIVLVEDFQELDLSLDKAEVKNLLGEALTVSLRLDEAEGELARAEDLARTDYSVLGKIFNNKGFVSIKRSLQEGLSKSERDDFLDRSEEEHLTALYFVKAAKDSFYVQIVENNLGALYARIGERRKSFVHFRNVLQMLGVEENPESRAFLFGNLSLYFQSIGDYSKAAAYLEQGIEINESLKADHFIINYCDLGTLFRLTGNPGEARKNHDTCLALARNAKEMPTVAEALLQLSIDQDVSGDLEQAMSSLREANALIPALESKNLRARIRTQYARLLSESGDTEGAEEIMDDVLNYELDKRMPRDEVSVYLQAMRIKREMDKTAEAIELGETAIEMIEDLHTHLEAEQLGPSWSDITHAVFVELTDIHLAEFLRTGKEESLAAAFLTSERSRAISLRQKLNSDLPADSLSLEEDRQLEVFSNIANMLAQTSDNAAIPAMDRIAYHYQHDLLALSRLAQVDDLAIPPAFSLRQTQEELKESQLVLYYLATPNSIYLLEIHTAASKLTRIGAIEEVTAQIDAAEIALRNSTSAHIQPLLRLSGTLLPDFSAYPKVDELLVVAHTGLYSLPMSAMYVSGPAAAPEPLITDFKVSYAPSVSAYYMKKPHRDRDFSAEIAILADPVFTPAEGLEDVELLAMNDSLRGWSDSLQPLPYTALEARNLQELFPERSLVYTGVHATRRNLSKPETRNARILHIATHGYFKSSGDDNVGLALSTMDAEGNADPGFISLTELFSYSFDSELVVISGCETAMGREQGGVGLNSLTRGFLAQGVGNVISTLWPVSDRASAEFMAVFYSHLKSTRDAAEALRLAQQELSRHPLYRHPFYWAAYTLTSTTP